MSRVRKHYKGVELIDELIPLGMKNKVGGENNQKLNQGENNKNEYE